MKHTKTMYDLLTRACKISHPECTTDLEALEAERSTMQSFKSLKEALNISTKNEIEMIAILDTVIEDLNDRQYAAGSKQLEQITI